MNAKNNINLHILQATGRLKSLSQQIAKSYDEAINRILNKVSVENIDIVVVDNPGRAIGELGVGGYTTNGNFITISLDPDFPNFEKAVGIDLQRIITHEISHAMRWRTSGYGKTLLEAIISEGLADQFEREITNEAPNRWSVALDSLQLKQMSAKAKKEYGNKNYNHTEWFFGSNKKIIPRWTGYALGFNIVEEYLKRNPSKKPSQLHDLKAEEFIK